MFSKKKKRKERKKIGKCEAAQMTFPFFWQPERRLVPGVLPRAEVQPQRRGEVAWVEWGTRGQ